MIGFLHYIHLIYLILTQLIQSSKGLKEWKHLFLKKQQGGNSMTLKKLDILFNIRITNLLYKTNVN